MAALSASRLVCSAMLWITLTTPLIFWLSSASADHFGGLLHAAGKPGNRLLHPADHFAAAGQGVGGLRQVAGGAGVLGDVVHGGGHFVDRGGGLIGFALLAEHAVAHVAHAGGQARGA
jgi:hypothetical protein